MIKIPYVLGAIAAYLLLTGKVKGVLTASSSNVPPPNYTQQTTSAPGGTWFNPSGYPNTANGMQSDVQSVAGAVSSVANTVGSIFSFLNPPKSTSGQGFTPASGSSSIPSMDSDFSWSL